MGKRRHNSYIISPIVSISILMIAACLICAAVLVWPKEAEHPTDPQLSATTTDASSSSAAPQETTQLTLPGSTAATPAQTTVSTVPATTQPTEPAQTTRPTEPAQTTQPTEPMQTTAPTQPTQTTAPTTTGPESTEPFDEAAFFSESVFLGDSVTLGLRNYCLSNKDALHGATILCAGSYAVRHAIDKVGGTNVISITYQGEKMRPEDALAAIGAKRVFIMLGLNDIGLVGIDKTIQNWGTLVNNIRAKCPDIEIYIQSGTPIQLGGEKGSLNNTNMDKYNIKLEQFCQENGCFFVNVAEALKNEQGGLREEYCSDDYCHLTNSGVSVWIQYLKDYAAAMQG